MCAPHSVNGSFSGTAFGSASEQTRLPTSAFGRKYVFQLAIVFAAYVLGGRLGLSIPFTSGNVSPIWPPSGIALAAVLLVGYRIWPAVAAGAFLVNVLTPISAGAAIALAAGNTTGAIAGAWLLWRLPGFRSSLNRLDDVLRLILLAAPAGAALSATIGVAVLFTTHVDPWLRFWPAWLVWWLGDMTGMLIVAPLVLTLGNQRRFPQARRTPKSPHCLAWQYSSAS